MMLNQVVYAASPYGYQVDVWKQGELKETYTGGNCPFDSQVFLEESDPDALPEKVLLRYAKQTALEMAGENGITRDAVYHDPHVPTGHQTHKWRD